MKIASLISGGKDSLYSAYLAGKENELVCLITLYSENKDSYMFHTPSITKVEKQAEVMGLHLITWRTKGEKEKELIDLEEVIQKAINEYEIKGITTGALHSDYQATRIQKICDKLGIKCINPLWHKDEISYLKELIEDDFKIIIIAVAAYPLNESWLGREINEKFVEDALKLKEKYKIHPAGEGGEFETFVLNCPLFKKELKVTEKKVISTGENSFKMEIDVE